jgi:hypothetical protein
MQSEDEVTKLIMRIRKLLALAGSSNVSEASSALEHAQALMIKYELETTHGLTLEAIKASHVTDDAIRMDGGMVTPRSSWQRAVGEGIGIMCNCRYFVTPVTIKGNGFDQHGYIGQRHSIAVARLMFGYLVKAVERMAEEGVKGERPHARRSYMLGCAFRLLRRMQDRAEGINAGLVPDLVTGAQLPMVLNTALAVRERIAEFVAKQPGFSKAVTRVDEERHDLAAFAAGAEAGDKIGLDKQVEGRGTRQLSGG